MTLRGLQFLNMPASRLFSEFYRNISISLNAKVQDGFSPKFGMRWLFYSEAQKTPTRRQSKINGSIDR
jgi:hypothetical protein